MIDSIHIEPFKRIRLDFITIGWIFSVFQLRIRRSFTFKTMPFMAYLILVNLKKGHPHKEMLIFLIELHGQYAKSFLQSISSWYIYIIHWKLVYAHVQASFVVWLAITSFPNNKEFDILVLSCIQFERKKVGHSSKFEMKTFHSKQNNSRTHKKYGWTVNKFDVFHLLFFDKNFCFADRALQSYHDFFFIYYYVGVVECWMLVVL